MKKIYLLLVIAIIIIANLSFAKDQKMIRIGVIQIVSHEDLNADQRGFEAALEGSGYKEGVQVIYERLNAEGDIAKAKDIAKGFIDLDLDLIHSIATPTTQAVVNIIRDIPVVFSSITDPVSAGIVPKNSAPGKKTGTNVTGVSDMWPVSLQMQTYAKFVPAIKKWGTIYNPADDNSLMHIKMIRDAAGKLGLELIEATVANRGEVGKAVSSLVGKVQAITITSDNTAAAEIDTIVNVCNANKIALFTGHIDGVTRGAIAAYGMDYFLVGYSAGKKAALILKGVKPGKIAWGPAEKFSLVINTKAATAQGVVIPPNLLKMADKVIK
jgi:putative ABC transport system substrate-binding protein